MGSKNHEKNRSFHIKKSPRTNLYFVIFGTVIALLSIEIGLRLFFDFGVPFELGEIEAWDPLNDTSYTPKLNELGFREEPLDQEIFSNNYTRILFLGDSFTFGQGISSGEKRFSDIIESEITLSVSKTADQRFHVYNASRPGSEPVDWLRFYERVEPQYRPDHVFAIFFLRDGTDLCTSFRCYEDIITNLQENYTDRLLYRHSHIGRWFYNQAMIQDFSDFYASQIIEAYLGDETQTNIWLEQQKALIELKNLSMENGSSFNLIIFPVLYNLDQNYQFFGVEEEIARFSADAEIPFFSLTSGFIGQDAETLWISPNDQHPNERGHRIAADTLLPYVVATITQ